MVIKRYISAFTGKKNYCFLLKIEGFEKIWMLAQNHIFEQKNDFLKKSWMVEIFCHFRDNFSNFCANLFRWYIYDKISFDNFKNTVRKVLMSTKQLKQLENFITQTLHPNSLKRVIFVKIDQNLNHSGFLRKNYAFKRTRWTMWISDWWSFNMTSIHLYLTLTSYNTEILKWT